MDDQGKYVVDLKNERIPLQWHDQLWNHRLRGERIMQLRDEYAYSEKRMKEFTGRP
jgi:hypothetical protein